jgi:hypothetical protein
MEKEEIVLQEKLKGLEEIALIHDKDGKEHKVWTGAYLALVIGSSLIEDDEPIASTCYLATGEHRGEWRKEKFRESKGLLETRLNVIKKAIAVGILNPSTGYLYGMIHPNNKASIKFFQNMGVHTDEVEVDGKKWIRAWVHVTEMMIEGKITEK